MIDMKINSTRKPTSRPKKEEPVLNEKPPQRAEEQPRVHIESRIEQLLDDKELHRPSVFISGWKSSSQKVKSNPALSASIQPEARPELPRRYIGTPQLKNNKRGIWSSVRWIILILLIGGGGYWMVTYFEKTTIHITEKHQVLSLSNTSFTASKSTAAPLHFEIMIVSDSDSKNMILTESENVSSKAKGIVTLYNEYSTKSQNLAINTQLNDSSGKAYRTDKAVTIPGYKTVSGKIVPGQVSVGVTSVLVGDAYNSTQTDFTIAGFKGTPKFTKLYAKATAPLTGGAQGLVYVLGATEKGSVNATAATTFKTRLLKKVTAEVPKGYILYPDAYTYTYSIVDDAQSPTPNAKIQINGTLSAVLLKESEITDAIIRSTLPAIGESERGEIVVPDVSKAAFSFANHDQLITKDLQTVGFTLTGDLNAVWHPDTEAFKSQLSGIPKANLTTLFKSDPGIAEARAILFPPWRKYLPTDLGKIHIVIDNQ